MSWYVSIGGQTYGPAETEGLREWHLAGSFQPTDFAWDEASQGWIEAGRIPALAAVFAAIPTPTGAIQDGEDPPQGPLLMPDASSARDAFCTNHPDTASESVCPRCRRSYCGACMAVVDGLSLCIDCDAEQKSEATRGRKRQIVTWGAPVLVVAGMLGAYTFLVPGPAEQPEEPAVVALERGAAPRLGPEDLSPEERETIEADLRALAAAFAAWKTETPAAAGRLVREAPDEWIQALADAGHLPAPIAPPREDLLYRLGKDGGRFELWTAGTTGRAFVVLADDQLEFLPRNAGDGDTSPGGPS